MKLEFKQYYESKKKLIESVDSCPKVKLQYRLDKYCKLPLHETVDSDEKIYISLKPDDIVEILWEYDTPDTPTVRYVSIVENDKILFPVWNSTKMFNWAVNNATEI
jgi:hypothetical protein